jgi:hypothetical protein
MPVSRFESCINSAAWNEAAYELLELCHPGDGYMSGKLPDGSAHVRLMVEMEDRVAPIDIYRPDSHLSLAILEAVIRGSILKHETGADGSASLPD